MGSEIEAKARVGDLDAVRERLAELKAVRLGGGLERNVVFDTPEGALRRSDRLLRLRSAGACTLTYKGPRQSAASAVKVRPELEVDVSDFSAAEEILLALGYVRVWRYEKRREQWSLGDARVMLDEVPRLGSFVEVEAPDEARVRAVLESLGISIDDVTPRTYLELFARMRESGGQEMTDMVFDDEHDSKEKT